MAYKSLLLLLNHVKRELHPLNIERKNLNTKYVVTLVMVKSALQELVKFW